MSNLASHTYCRNRFIITACEHRPTSLKPNLPLLKGAQLHAGITCWLLHLCTVSTGVERPPQGLQRLCACWTRAGQRAARQEATYSATQIRAGPLSLHRMGWASGAEQIVAAGHPADSWRAVVRDIHAKGRAVTLAAVKGPLRAAGGADALEGDWHGVDVEVAVPCVMQAPAVQHYVLDELIHLRAALTCQEVRALEHDAWRLKPAWQCSELAHNPLMITAGSCSSCNQSHVHDKQQSPGCAPTFRNFASSYTMHGAPHSQ